MADIRNNMRYTLNKSERLRHRTLVDKVFSDGKSFYEWPLRMAWRKLSEDELNASFRNNPPQLLGELQMLVTVPKKKRRLAVDRVLMRRRIREAYRLNRLALKETVAGHPDLRTLSLAFIYLADKNIEYAVIEQKMKTLLNKLEKSL